MTNMAFLIVPTSRNVLSNEEGHVSIEETTARVLIDIIGTCSVICGYVLYTTLPNRRANPTFLALISSFIKNVVSPTIVPLDLGTSSSPMSPSFTHLLAKRLSIRTHRLVNFGIDQYFSARFAIADHQNSTHLPDLPLPGVALANDTRPEWSSILREMGGTWTASFGGLIILAPYVKPYWSESH